MKSNFAICCTLAVGIVLLLVMSGCRGGKVVTRTFPQESILTVAEMQALPERTNPNNYVVMVEKGERIPIELHLESELASFAQDRVELELKERLYFRLEAPEHMTAEDWRRLDAMKTNDFSRMDRASLMAFLRRYMLFISRDSVHWAPISGVAACKEVVGIKSGEFFLGLMASSESGVQASFTMKTHSVDEQ